MRDFTKLHPTEHMLQWLAGEPYTAISEWVEASLQRQVAGSQLNSFIVTSQPSWLTSCRPDHDNPDLTVLVRTGVAFEFQLLVCEVTGVEHQLQGVLTWVGVHLDQPEKSQIQRWLDIDETLDTQGAKGALRERLYFA
jgi:hypothetical protein